MFNQIFFLLFVLPFLILHEGYTRFGKGLTSRKTLERVPYILIIVLLMSLLALFIQGYRF